MEVSVENTSTLGRRLKVSVPDATVKAQIKTKMAKLAREVRLKGFRPGKVPTNVLEQKFGQSIRSEVINELIRQSLGDAFQKNELQPAGMPTIEEIKDELGQNLEFVASFEIYPNIELASLSDAEVEKRIVEITDNDVKIMIEKLKDQLANWEVVERAVKNGDRLTVDFARLLKQDDAKREEQQNVQMVVGAVGVLPGLSDALIGKLKGAQIEAELRYPADWADASVAEKEVTLWVTIHDVSEKQPLSDDALAEKLSIPADETEKLAVKVRERMQEELETALQDEIKEKILEKLLEKNPIEIPNALVMQEKEAIRREMSRARRVEIPMEALKGEEVESSARRRVELGLLLNEVIKKHNLKADSKRVRASIEKIATKFSSSPEIVDAYYGNKDLLYGVERMVLLEQAVEAILKEVKVQEIKATFDDVMNPVEEKSDRSLIEHLHVFK